MADDFRSKLARMRGDARPARASSGASSGTRAEEAADVRSGVDDAELDVEGGRADVSIDARRARTADGTDAAERSEPIATGPDGTRPATDPPPPGSAGLTRVELGARLARRAGTRFGSLPATAFDREDSADLPGELTVGPPERLDERSGPRGRWFERVTRFAADHVHGDWRLDEVRHADPASFALLTGDARLAQLDPRAAVYLDTETTGLSGGAGTYVFQVGLGRFDDDGFELWQGFMAGPEDEPGLLDETARRVRESGGVVSFFGKAFDRHRLEDKMRLHAVAPPFAETPHLDLYHPLRRLYRGAFDDCRLRTMERELTGLDRPDDLPGSLAPAAWFDFLQERAHRLEGVFRHNADDVLSLVTLAAYLGRVERGARSDERALAGCAASRARTLAAACFDARREEEGRAWVARALEADVSEQAADVATRCALRLASALSLKRSKLPAEAWRELEALLAAPAGPWSVTAAIEAAKLLEHDLRDRTRAREVAAAARARCDALLTGSEYARSVRDLDRRLARLAGSAAGE